MRVARRSAFAALIFLLATQALVAAQAAEKIFDKKFPAVPGGTLSVETDQGSIVVNGTDGKEVVVRVTFTGPERRLRDFDVTAETDSKGVSVRGKRFDTWWLDLGWLFGSDLRARFDIQVPRDYHVELRTAGGSIESRDINGKVYGRTSGGRVTLTSINGDIDVYTSGGRIEARQLVGSATLRTSGGSMTIADTRGDLSARTSGGAIHLQNIDGKVDARTSGGSIDANLLGKNRGVNLRTSGGSIRVEIPRDFKATLDAHTSGGSVRCELPLTSMNEDDRERGKNWLSGDINGGGETISARTSGGGIRITSASAP